MGGRDRGAIFLRPFIDRNELVRQIPSNITDRSDFSHHIYSDWFSKSPILYFPYLYNWVRFNFFGEQLDRHQYTYPSAKYSAWDYKAPNFWKINTKFLERSTDLFQGKQVVVAFLPSSGNLERSD